MRVLKELSNEYQHDRVYMIFKYLCILVLWTKVASALEGLIPVLDTIHNTHINWVGIAYCFRSAIPVLLNNL